ncbi:MAG: prevent-host-death protein [Chloroflexota bacterium]
MIYQIKQSELPKKLWNLIDAALRGEPVFIERDDKALVQLIPLKQMFHPRKAGSAKGMVKMTSAFVLTAPTNRPPRPHPEGG